ncbi:fungal-specific transcription factor domain-containing protein [Aspergillus multicolor]|uniref:transcription factor domain-containing protein n=1 Tax=Aspergillus multicolor TaxID=41759 RepID=UPI003CCDC5FF
MTTNESRFFCDFATVVPHVFVLAPPQLLGQVDVSTSLESAPESFLSVIIRLSTRDQMVLNSALALGASHWNQCLSAPSQQTDGNNALGTVTVGSESERLSVEKVRLAEDAERELSRRVNAYQNNLMQTHADARGKLAQQTEAEALVSSYRLLYLYDVSEVAGNGSWRDHLNGARDVLLNLLSSSETVQGTCGEGRRGDEDALPGQHAFAEFFSYHYTLRCVTSHLQANNDTVFQAGSLFSQGISSLQSEAETVPSGPMIVRAVEIWKDLDDWGHDTELPSDYHVLSRAYTTACFMWLFSILYPENINDDRVQAVVGQCLELLSSIETEALRPFLLLPIFVAGVACTRQQDRAVLSVVLGQMQAYHRRGNIELCDRLIRRSWDMYNTGDKRSWDWKRLMAIEGVKMPVV